MPTLIQTAEQLKSYLGGLQKSMDFKTIEPFVATAERRFIQTAIGKDFFEFLCATTDTTYSELKALAQKATAWYAYLLALPHLRVVSGDLGVMMNQPSRTTMAPKWAHVDLVSSTSENADAALEDLLEALEGLDADPWKNSEGFKANRSRIIRNATQLTQHLPLVQSRRRTFLALRFHLSKAEDSIARDICTAQVFDALKTKYTETPQELTPAEKRLLFLLADLIAPYALYRAIPGLRLRIDSDGIYVMAIDDSMKNQTPTTYPAVDELRKELVNSYKEAETALTKYLDETATETIFAAYFTKKQAKTSQVVTLSNSSLGFF